MEVTGTMVTDVAVGALWAPGAFDRIVDHDEDIAGHIAAGTLVPVDIESDGRFAFVARIGTAAAPARWTEREREYAYATSAPYLLTTAGGAVISGLEHVRADPSDGVRFPLPAGRWTVTVALIDWESEPGQTDDDGEPAPTALPDLTILLNPETDPTPTYRTSAETFGR
ncbi:hypothetical protein [Actinoplanes sp. NPDC048796]|uniref:hypothetical protein n=1 Tax=unclassified Actinoplanes TaxID=2626549 RepID=UPI0033FB17E9